MRTAAHRAAEATMHRRYQHVRGGLTDRARRLFVASEALAFGYGGIAAAARATGMAATGIVRGITELCAIEAGVGPVLPPTRSRRPGGGRKKATDKDPTLLADLRALVESTTRGDPEAPLLWTARSQRHLVTALAHQGHATSPNLVARLLTGLGYRRHATRNCLEGTSHPDRNAQFEHINETIRHQLETHEPVISVDTNYDPARIMDSLSASSRAA